MEDSVNVLKFAECRAQEIMTLMSDVVQKEPKALLQKLPFHMRRRAASHNPKRLPRSLRKKVSDESKSKHKKKPKPHKNLLEEYNSRQKSDQWLPTHIWFAKRFHMKRMWGYQLPFQATGKRFRSSYRATVKNALLQDLSYFCCIELRGEEKKILSRLSHLTDESLGMNFASESYIDGTKEGHCFLYHADTFPLRAIGPVSFLWKPHSDLLPKQNDSSISYRHLWLWCHPSIVDELVKVFIDIFQLTEELKKTPKQYNFASHVNYMKCQLHFQKEPVYVSDDIFMFVLKDTLVRHRIIGPNASSIITNILKPVKSNDQSSQLSEKQSVWQILSDPQLAYSLPIKTVIGITVEDPRLHVTSKNMDSFKKTSLEDDVFHQLSKPEIAYSDLWDYEIRNKITAAQVPETVINEERGKYAIPAASDLNGCTTSVPIIVIHQPATNGYAPGWDIIAPQGWGMAFWIPLIYHGAQPAGFDDLCCTNFESGCPTFPLSFPDTEAGSAYEENSRQEKLKKHNRYSRAKRPNFKILGVPSPFFMPWKLLISEWEKNFLNKYNTSTTESSIQNTDSGFFVLRNKKDIIHLQKLIKPGKKMYSKEIEDAHYNMIQSILISQNAYLKTVVLIRVKCLFRGTPTSCSGIYLPNESDLQTLKANPRDFGPVETKHNIDELSNMPAKKRRKILKEEAKRESKILDKPKVETVISISERKIIGYVSEGGYSRLGSQGYGIGHCVITGLLFLLELCMKYQSDVVVLIREQHTFQYRAANIEILSHIF